VLAELEITHPRVLVPEHQEGVDPATLLELARGHGLEGVVGKRLDSTYRPGRSPAWIKHALRNRLEVVVAGWTPGQGNRSQSLGALLMARPAEHDPAVLEFVGAVGTGWTATTAARLRQVVTLDQRHLHVVRPAHVERVGLLG
jgi:bifunctional non-homologous end joining protein LigD